MADYSPEETQYLAATVAASKIARRYLEWMEGAFEKLAPQRSAALAVEATALFGNAIAAADAELEHSPPPEELKPFAERFREGFTHIVQAYENFAAFPTMFPPESIERILAAMHHCACATEMFYILRQALQPFTGFWDLPGSSPSDEPNPNANERVGLTHVSRGGEHGGFSLYVPESYTPEREWPVIVALHGGSGNGRDFLWTWVREARSLGYILLAPSALLDTWGEGDDTGILQILVWLDGHYRIDRRRILMTGLSDGATFGLLYGLLHPDVYRAIAPLCGVLHPANEDVGNLERAAGKPIYLVHGALDFLFPVQMARFTRDVLERAGADLTYRELAELSHTYPRSENVRILEWFAGLGRDNIQS